VVVHEFPFRPGEVIHQWTHVLDRDELDFWRKHHSNPDFWEPITSTDHIEGQPHHQTFSKKYWEENCLTAPYAYINHRMHKYVEFAFGDDFLLKPDPTFRRWVAGTHMGGHGDGFLYDNKLDFQTRGPTIPRAFFEVATVLYYNDDFEGGELEFPELGMTIRPEPGKLVAFPCSYGYEHRVTEVTSGVRDTSATHWIRCGTIARALMGQTIPTEWWKTYENTDTVFEMMDQTPPK